MHRLTRVVRFAINAAPDNQLAQKPANSYGGYPSLTGMGQFFELRVTVEGPLQPPGDYLLPLKNIDAAVREKVVPIFSRDILAGQFGTGIPTLLKSWPALRSTWENLSLARLQLDLTPYCAITLNNSELPMIRLSQKFEFCASHRLHNATLSADENRRIFGKCNNSHGHGHNYELQVTLRGKPDANGQLLPIADFERIVSENVIEKFDHKNLNCELPEFREAIPSVENIARVIYQLLKPRFTGGVELALVTVWETSKTSSEYGE